MISNPISMISRLFGWILAQNRRFRTLAAIEGMDTRMLEDIGFTREPLIEAIRRGTPQHLQAIARTENFNGAF
jgi:uncharacterized protein YjiS (DUF1127 family)